MIPGQASYDYIIRKRNLFFSQTNFYAIFLGTAIGAANFDYSMSIQAIDTVAIEIANLDYFSGNIDVDSIDNVDSVIEGVDYFGYDVKTDAIDNVAARFSYPFIMPKGNIDVVPVTTYKLPLKNEYKANFANDVTLIVFSLAEMRFDTGVRFTSVFTAEGLTYNDLTTTSAIHFESSALATQVTVDELGFTADDNFESELNIIKVYTYGLVIPAITDYIESTLSLDHVTYRTIEAIELDHFGAAFDMDSVELVEDSYLLEMHLQSVLEASSVNTVSMNNIDVSEIALSSEFEPNLMEVIHDMQIVGNTYTAAVVSLEPISGYAYFEFNQEIMHITGAISSMFLMRDRLINNDEYFNLSINTFLDLSIGDLLEVNV